MNNKIVYRAEINDPVEFGAVMTFPTGFDPKKESLPMIVFLHGSGERGSDTDALFIHGIPKYFGADPDYHGLRVITFSPQCPDGVVWDNVTYPLMKLIKKVAAEFNADPSRISLTGISMGGYGTWDLAENNPDFFSAVAPICAGGATWRAGALTGVPIRVFHGDADTAVPVEYAHMMTDAVNSAGGHAELTIFPGEGHASWIPAYETTDLIEWLVKQKKEK